MTTKLEQIIVDLANDTQAIPNQNQMLMALREALDEWQRMQEHFEQTEMAQARTIQALESKVRATGALCDKYQPRIFATEYTIDPSYTLQTDLLSRCDALTLMYEGMGYVESVRIRVKGAL